MLVDFKELLAEALVGQYAVGYFEAWDMYSLEAVLDAAEMENVPVILGFGGVMMKPGWLAGNGLERLAALGLATAKSAKVPVAFILNEVSTFEQVVRGSHAGFNVVMQETSDLPYAENVRLTRQIVRMAHAVGVGVEAALGLGDFPGGRRGRLAGPVTGCLRRAGSRDGPVDRSGRSCPLCE